MIASLCLAASLLLFSPGPDPIPLPEVSMALPVGSQIVLVHPDGAITIVDVAALVIDTERLGPASSSSFPPLAILPGSAIENPNVITITYPSAQGSVTVTTPCKGMSEDLCAEKAKKQLDAMQKVLPRVGTTDLVVRRD